MTTSSSECNPPKQNKSLVTNPLPPTVPFPLQWGGGPYFLASLDHTLPAGDRGRFQEHPDTPAEAIDEWVKENETRDQFFLVAQQKRGAVKRRKCDISHTWWLWADIDDKDTKEGGESGEERLRAFTPQPHFIVSSGHGSHAYWRLKKPLDIASDEGALLTSCLKKLASQLGGDSAVADPSRVMRLPGSINHKDPQNPVAVEVVFDNRAEGAYSIVRFGGKEERRAQPKRLSITQHLGGKEEEGEVPTLKAMLAVLNTVKLKEGERQLWLNLGTSLKAAYPVAGFEGFNKWSSKNPGYKEGEMEYEWGQFKSEAMPPSFLMNFRSKTRNGYEMKFGKIDPLEVVNIQRAIREIGVECKDNLWTGKTDIKAETTNWLAPEPRLKEEMQITERACKWMANEIKHSVGFSPIIKNVRLAAENNSFENKYHPVVDETRKEEWDGEKRLETWMIKYLNVTDNLVNRELSSIFIRSMVKRVHEPGVEVDAIPVFIGEQGCRKSSMLRALATGKNFRGSSKYFSNKVRPGELFDANKKAMELTRGKWIVEIREFGGNVSKNVDEIKDYMGEMEDEARLSYEGDAEIAPRQFVVAATTNRALCLNDPTGSRRFWPVEIPRGTLIDTDGLVKVRYQLFAEALTMIDQPLTMSVEGKAVMEERGREAYKGLPFEDMLREEYENSPVGTLVTTTDFRDMFECWNLSVGERKECRADISSVFPEIGFKRGKWEMPLNQGESSATLRERRVCWKKVE